MDSSPLPVRFRSDLIVAQTGSEWNPLWTVKDPIAERFYQLRQPDYFVFRHLDGKTSLSEIQRRYYSSHAPRRLSDEQILLFIQRLFSQGLVHVEKFGLSETIHQRSERLQAAERKQQLTSLLAIRFRGCDPDRLLDTYLPCVRWLFSPACLALGILLFCFALSLVFAEWELIVREFPTFNIFLNGGQLFWFIGTIAAIKILHELAHAFACKHFGGECHELGVMLLAFTPCLYCNVSDSWLMQNRWQRIAISGAGIYLEIMLASICTFVWYWTVPGVLHTMCLYLMVISSVSTLFLNGNPLLRYDGYYILSDLAGVPNLRSRSHSLIRSWGTRLFFGLRTVDPFREQGISKGFLGLYGVCSGIYVWFVVFAILWMLYHVAKPYGLEALVIGLGVVLISSRIVGILKRLAGFVYLLHKQERLRVKYFGIALTLAGVLLFSLLTWELPRRVTAPCVVESGSTSPVYLSVPGRIEFINLHPGKTVAQGELLARLSNPELERELVKLQGIVTQQEKRIELLLQRQTNDETAAAEIPTARTALRDFQEQLRIKQADFKRLELRAPQSGIILPLELSRSSSIPDEEFLLSGVVIDRHNNGAWLETGTVLCSIADPESYAALLYCHQSEAALLTPGAPVTLTCSQTGGQRLTGNVIEIAAQPARTLPPALLRLELLPLQPDETGTLRPATPVHEVRVRVTDSTTLLALGQTGKAVIHLQQESLFTNLMRLTRQTFTFSL